jgi:hypothetical protein
MNPWLLLAALLCAFATALHALVGGRMVLGPLRAESPSRRFAVVEVVWHLITWHLAVLTAGLAYVAFVRAPIVADLLLAHWVGYAALFLFLSRLRFGRALALPQWTLFVCLAAVTAAGRWSPVPQAAVGTTAALAAAAALFAIGVLHVYWALGGVWPGRDRASLSRTVVGAAPGERMPSRGLTLVVAGALAVAAGVVLGTRDLIPAFGVPAAAFTAAAWALCAVLLLRGVGGFFEIYVRRGIAGTPYAFWNERLYSPLCLALSTCVALAAAR